MPSLPWLRPALAIQVLELLNTAKTAMAQWKVHAQEKAIKVSDEDLRSAQSVCQSASQ